MTARFSQFKSLGICQNAKVDVNFSNSCATYNAKRSSTKLFSILAQRTVVRKDTDSRNLGRNLH